MPPLHPVRALQPVLEAILGPAVLALLSTSIKGSRDHSFINALHPQSVWKRVIQNHFLHMCGKLWSEWYFLNVTLCLKDSMVMKVGELAAGHRGAMTNSWCHGLIVCVCVEVRWLTAATRLSALNSNTARLAQRSPLDTLKLVAREAPPEIN